MRKKYFVLGLPEQPRQDTILLDWHDEPNKPTKKGPLSFVLFEAPFTSVSTVSRGHPSLYPTTSVSTAYIVSESPPCVSLYYLPLYPTPSLIFDTLSVPPLPLAYLPPSHTNRSKKIYRKEDNSKSLC